MNANPKIIAAVLATAVLAVVVGMLTFGGGGVPGDAAAIVGDTKIPRSEFDRYLRLAYRGQTSGGAAVIPDPPDFKKCVADRRKKQPGTTDADLKSTCKNEYDGVVQQGMSAMIEAEWYRQEAERRKILVPETEVKKRLLEAKKGNFPQPGDYEKFLKNTNQTETDVLRTLRDQLIKQKVKDQAEKYDGTVTEKQKRDWYNSHKKKYFVKESAHVFMVFSTSESDVKKAKQAVEGGAKWPAVVKKYSEDPTAAQNRGEFREVKHGDFEPELEKAIFAAKIGSVSEPIFTQYGYYVFEVIKRTPAHQKTLKEADPLIPQDVVGEREKKAKKKFQQEFRARWRAKSECAKGYIVALCKNGPPLKPSQTT